MQLDEQLALVTGASGASGASGHAIARDLAARDTPVVLGPRPPSRGGRPDEVTASAISILTNGCLTSQVIYLDEGMYPP